MMERWRLFGVTVMSDVVLHVGPEVDVFLVVALTLVAVAGALLASILYAHRSSSSSSSFTTGSCKPAAVTSATPGFNRRSIERGLYRRMRPQRHDGSSTLEQASSIGSASATSSSTGPARFGDSFMSHLPTSLKHHSTSSEVSHSRCQVTLPAEHSAMRLSLDQPGLGQDLHQASDQDGRQPQEVPTEQQVFVPTWVPPAPSPLQTVSAPLTDLSTASSSNSQDNLPTVQSLSDPSGSISMTPSTLAHRAHHPATLQGGPSGRQLYSSRSRSLPATLSGKEAAAAATAGIDASNIRITQQAAGSESSAAASLDLAALLAPNSRSQAPGGQGHAAALPPAAHPQLHLSAAAPAAAGPSAAGPSRSLPPQVRPLGMCLPAPPWPTPGGTAGLDAREMYTAAAARTTASPNALYTSPLHHVTISVKVPTPFTPAAASNLQSLVARHVWAGERHLAAADSSSQQPVCPQHTVLHMVSIPGCIQMMVNISQWDPAAAPELGPNSSPAATGQTPAAGILHSMQVQEWPPGPAMLGGGSGADAVSSMPAPAWLVEAVCKAVEEFMRGTAPGQGRAGSVTSTTGSSGSGRPRQLQGLQPLHDAQQVPATGPAQRSYDGPVLMCIDGSLYALEPGADPEAAWLLQECQAPLEAAQQSLASFMAPGAAAAGTTANMSGAGTSGAAAASPQQTAGCIPPSSSHFVAQVPARSAATASQTAVHHVSSGSVPQPPTPAAPHSPGWTAASASRAATRRFIRTVASGVAEMHVQGGAGLFAPLTPDPPPAPPGGTPIAHRGADTSQPTTSDSQPAVLQLSTSTAPAHVLPPGIWAWPLYLAVNNVAGDPASAAAAAAAGVRVAVCGSSSALPVVAMHGLAGVDSCRVVLSAAGGAVLMDTRVHVQGGVASFTAPESNKVRSSKIYYLLPPAATATAPQTPGSSANTSGALPPAADQLLCMLPLLHLPPESVIELCEAARALMLEHSAMMFTQQLHQQEQEQTPMLSGASGEESYTGITDLSDSSAPSSSMLGTLSMARPGTAASAAAAAAAADTINSGDGSSGIHPGLTAEVRRAQHGISKHEGSFDTAPPSSAGRLEPQSHSLDAAAADTAAAADRTFAQGTAILPTPPSSSTSDKRVSGQGSTSGADSGGSGSGGSGLYESRTGLEDEPNMLNLRGRLFQGSTDVHRLLNTQYLPILADLGLLIDLAAASGAAAAAGDDDVVAASTATTAAGALVTVLGEAPSPSSSGGGSLGASVAALHGQMASEVAQQLLVWFADRNCWSCCQLVLQLLQQLGVQLHFHGQPVAPASIASVRGVQQLLAGTRAQPQPPVDSMQQAGGTGPAGPQPAGVSAAQHSGVSRAGVWGHLPPLAPAAAAAPGQEMLTPQFLHNTLAPHSTLGSLRQLSSPTGVSGLQGTGAGGSSSIIQGVRGVVGPLQPRMTSQHHDTNGNSMSSSYLSCSSAEANTEAASPDPAAAWPMPVTDPRAIPAEPLSAFQTAAAEAGVAAAQQHTVAGDGGRDGDGGGVRGDGDREHKSRRLTILDSASDMWTRLRRRRSKGARAAEGEH